MAVCAFVGSIDVYDSNIYVKLRKALNEIVRENDSVDFLFHAQVFLRKTVFEAICLHIAYQAKLFHKDKHIRICAVVDYMDRNKYLPKLQFMGTGRHLYHVDTILPVYYKPPGMESITRIHQMERWIVEHSDYVVCYQYRFFHEKDYSLQLLADEMGKRVIDLTSETTRNLIVSNFKQLPDRERYVMELWAEGITFAEISNRLSVSNKMATHIVDHAAKGLRDMMPKRVEFWPYGEECTILHLPKPTYENMLVLSNTLSSLKETSGLSTVYLSEEYIGSPYRYVIERNPVSSLVKLRFTSFPAGDNKAIFSGLCNGNGDSPPWAKSMLWLCDSEALSQVSCKIKKAIERQGSYIVNMDY